MGTGDPYTASLEQAAPIPPILEIRLVSARTLFYAACILAAGLAAYSNSFNGVFLMDDYPWIINKSSTVTDPADYLNLFVTSGRRYLVMLSLAINESISGTSPWSYHVFNVAVHLISALAIFGIVRRTLLTPRMRERFAAHADQLALLIAVLFAVHPLQTQSVSYVIQRSQSMMGMFQFLALYCFIRGAYSRVSVLWYLGSALCCIFGLDVKPHMIGMPISFILYDRAFLSRSFKEMFQRHKYFYAFIAWVWIVNVGDLTKFVGSVGGVDIGGRGANPEGIATGMTTREYALSQFECVAWYLRLSLWPHPLCFDYTWPTIKSATEAIPYALIIVPLGLASVFAIFKSPAWGFVGTWFFLNIGPSSSFVARPDVLVEHRMYVPLIAVIAGVVLLAHWAYARYGSRLEELARRRARFAAWGVSLVTVVAFGALTFRRNMDYQSGLAMWSDVVAKRPQNPRAHNNLGLEYRSVKRLSEAELEFRAALNLNPGYWQANYNLGLVLDALGRAEDAITQYEIILSYGQPVPVTPLLPDVYNAAGWKYREKNDLARAEMFLRKALAMNPAFWPARLNLGFVLSLAGRHNEALVEYREAQRLNAVHPELVSQIAYSACQWGMTLCKQGRWEEAEAYLRQALEINPQLPDAVQHMAEVRRQLTVLNQEQTQLQSAVATWKQALQSNPADAKARYGAANAENELGLMFKNRGRLPEAELSFREAIRCEPTYWQAHFNLALVLETAGRLEDTVTHYREALRLNPESTRARPALTNALNNHGLALRTANKLPEAEAVFREAIKTDAVYWQAHFNLGLVLEAQNKLIEARDAYGAAAKLNPDFSEAKKRMEELPVGP